MLKGYKQHKKRNNKQIKLSEKNHTLKRFSHRTKLTIRKKKEI